MKSDPRNQSVRHYINGRFVSQYEPALSLFDAGFLHGKQVWSAPRLINYRIFKLEAHLEKIQHSATVNHFPVIPRTDDFIKAIRVTLKENKMSDGVHIRVLLTAGHQVTASMDLAAIIDWQGGISEPQIIVMPEYRGWVYDVEQGIPLITSSFKRPGPEMVDQTSHDNNQNASSRALAEAKRMGVTSSLMYDADGYLAEAPASHVALVRSGKLYTPYVRCCPEGVTRQAIMEACTYLGIDAYEADLTQTDVAHADELMLLGTMSGPVGVTHLDHRPVGTGLVGPITRALQAEYQSMLLDPKHSYPIFESD
ncbi:MAG: aminotransferase class IV [Betaproteobacteria bacterium]|jgi:branched-chain amino acid aminotransferase